MLPKKTLIIWLLIATINSTCNEGCVRCGADDKCQTCDLQLGWKLVGDSCQRNVDTKCILNGAQDSCLLCNQNFFYDATQRKCVRSSRRLPLCLHMQDNILCDVCVKGYYPLDGVCKLVQNPIDNCKYHRDIERCMQCEEGYWPSSDFKKCLKTPNSDELDNCKYYSNLYCQKCEDGTIQNPNNYLYNLFSKPDVKKYQSYVQNMQFQYSDNVIDAQCEPVQVQYCKVYKSAIECQQCNNGYYLNEGKCIINPFVIIDNCIIYSASDKCSRCQPQYYPHNEQTECRKAVNEIQNCEIRNLNECIQCYDGYYKNGSVCSEQIKIDNCDTYSSTAAKCTQCVDGLRLTNDNLKCLPEILNCKTYSSSNQNDIELVCTACTNSTYLDDNKQCVSGEVVNCLDYQTNGKQCQRCVNGYYLEGNQCIAHMTIENCNLYSNSLKNTCTECKTDHFLFNLEKLCYAAFEILHCLSYSDRDNCSSCEQGYFLENNECKLIPEEENCLVRGLPNSDCTLCKKGYYINTTVSPNVCIKQFEQQQLGCYQDSTDTNNNRHYCSICKGSHFFLDLVQNSVTANKKANICGKIDRIPEAQRVENCIGYIDNGTNDWKCLKCKTGYYLSDQSGNSGDYGDTCSETCDNTIKVLEAKFNRDTSNANQVKLEQFNDFTQNRCVTLTTPDDQCQYWVPINKTTNGIFDYKCGKLKESSSLILKLNYNPGDESSYGFANDFNLPTRFGYAAPTYTLDNTTISTTYPGSNQDKCQSWKVNTNNANNKYCDKCIHKYTSSATASDSNNENTTSYLKCDTVIPDCETDVLGGFINDYRAFKRHKVNPMHVSCHTCSSTNQIPFIHLPLDGDAKWETQWYQPFKVEETTDVPKDSPVKDGLVTQCREPTPQGLTIKNEDFTREFPSNCGMGLFNVGISKTFKDSDSLTDVSVFCLVCKPGFKAVYNTDGFLSNCEEIANCKKVVDQSVDKFVNGCAQCELEYNYRFDSATQKIEFDECVSQVVPNCLVSNGDDCVFCKKGYYLENNKTCNRLIVPKCINYNYVDYTYNNVLDSTDLIQSQISFAIYLSAFNRGCLQCTSNYYQLYKYPVEQKQCVSSFNLIEQQYENSSYLINHCALYKGNEEKKCHRCNSLYIPNSDDTKCIEQLQFYRCARVDEVNTGQFVCTECEQNFYLVKNQCRRGTIENCTSYNTNTLPMKCEQCKNTYRVSRDNQSCILGNLPYCNLYENQFETSCKTCNDDEHPLVSVNKQNVSVKRCFRDLTDFHCQQVNAAQTEDSIYQCDKCQQGYYLSDPDEVTSRNICVSISPITHCKTYDYQTNIRYPDSSHKCTECTSGYYVSEYGYSCKVRDPSVEFCQVFSPNSLQCQTCQEGYFLSNDKMTCYLNPTGVRFCEEYSSSTNCIKCTNGYYLSNNKCLKVDDDLIVTGCVQYNEEQLCVQCNQNYYFDSVNNTCNDPNASGCLTYIDINTCGTCPQGKVFQEIQQGEQVIRNCIDYNLQFCLDINPETRRCNLCATSYYPQEDGTCSVAELIPNCLYYESETECMQCEDGFYRTSNKKECFQTGFNLMNSQSTCQDVIYKEEQQCVACEDGMYFKDGKCVACSIENCLACDPRLPTQCLICKSGYTQKNQFGNCDINLNDNIVLPGEDDGTDNNEDNEEHISILNVLTLLLIALFN